MSPRPTLICATPVRNEAWIIGQFVAAASVWADVIILIDQRSSDATREIAAKFPKVRIAENPMPEYNEGHYRKLMFAEARKIPGPRLIFALDADEFLNADLFGTPAWDAMLTMPPGQVARGHWVNLYDSFRSCHIVDDPVAICYMDDGGQPQDTFIHCRRLPDHPTLKPLDLRAAKLLHYQYIPWARMKAKQRWYQALETLKEPHKSTVGLYRVYHHMDITWARKDPVDDAWFAGYEARGIPVRQITPEAHPWYEAEMLKLFEQHGAARFRKLAIWDVDWVAIAAAHNVSDPQRFRDPRNALERAVHRWLRRTQDNSRTFSARVITKVLRGLGW